MDQIDKQAWQKWLRDTTGMDTFLGALDRIWVSFLKKQGSYRKTEDDLTVSRIARQAFRGGFDAGRADRLTAEQVFEYARAHPRRFALLLRVLSGEPKDGSDDPQVDSPNEQKALALREACRASEDGKPEGTPETLAQCARMLLDYAPDCFPANEQGQVHFLRAMMESVADEIFAYLEKLPPTVPENPAMTITPAEGWELVKPEDGMKEGDLLTIGGVFHSNAYGHDVELTGVFNDGTVYYRILSGERQGEEHFKHVTHFRVTYSPKKEQP